MNIKSQNKACVLCETSNESKKTWIKKIMAEVKESKTRKQLTMDHSPICNACKSQLNDYGVMVKVVSPQSPLTGIQLTDV